MPIWRSSTPPKLGLKDVLDRLRSRLLEQRAKGVTVTQMHEVLKERGIEIGERSLKAFLDKGELPGRKAAKVGCAGGGDRCREGIPSRRTERRRGSRREPGLSGERRRDSAGSKRDRRRR